MLSDYLYNFKEFHLFFNLFGYISFRSGLPLISSFILIIIFMPYWIKFQKVFNPLGQPIRDDGPLSHLSKSFKVKTLKLQEFKLNNKTLSTMKTCFYKPDLDILDFVKLEQEEPRF